MLSEENRRKINVNGLYRHKPTASMRKAPYKKDLFHCMNWTFNVCEDRNGSLVMADTYWTVSPNRYEVTDRNVDEWELIFDKFEVRQVSEYEAKDYAEEDRFHIAVDSGGVRHGKWFVKNNAEPSAEIVSARLKAEIERLNAKVAKKQEELREITGKTETAKDEKSVTEKTVKIPKTHGRLCDMDALLYHLHFVFYYVDKDLYNELEAIVNSEPVILPAVRKSDVTYLRQCRAVRRHLKYSYLRFDTPEQKLRRK